MTNILRNSTYIVISLILFGCFGSKRLNEFDLAESYEISGIEYTLEASFESLNDSISQAKVKINPNDFLFSKTKTNNYLARYSIGYKVFEGYNQKSPIDSTTIHYSLKQGNKSFNNYKFHNIKLFAPIGKNYIIKIFITDENRNFKSSQLFTHRKKSTNARSFFKISGKSKEPNYTVFQKDSFEVKRINHKSQFLRIQIFESKLTCAAKPHEVNHSYVYTSIPDTSWDITTKEKLVFPPLKNRYYHFITDTSSKEGFSVFTVGNNFPKVSSITEANGALGYLLGKGDYGDLLREPDNRKAFENAWLKLSGNRERARNLIKEYYSVASISNQLFTSNQPGWSTDRGMVYIIFGPPRIVYRYDNSEIWIYGEENNLLSEQFEFRKIHSNHSDNIYELKRNINYKINFNRMVNAWVDDRGY